LPGIGLDAQIDRLETVCRGSARGPLLAGVLDNEDRVFARERNQQDKTDLGVQIIGKAEDHEGPHSTQERKRHR
jgi:hypothetical protein